MSYIHMLRTRVVGGQIRPQGTTWITNDATATRLIDDGSARAATQEESDAHDAALTEVQDFQAHGTVLPIGGDSGAILVKASDANFDTKWGDLKTINGQSLLLGPTSDVIIAPIITQIFTVSRDDIVTYLGDGGTSGNIVLGEIEIDFDNQFILIHHCGIILNAFFDAPSFNVIVDLKEVTKNYSLFGPVDLSDVAKQNQQLHPGSTGGTVPLPISLDLATNASFHLSVSLHDPAADLGESGTATIWIAYQLIETP